MQKKITEKLINSVFPNKEDYNSKKYIKRNAIETEIQRALARYRFVFLSGDSGCGKTWLIKNYLSTSPKDCEYINLSDVDLSKSLIEYFKNQIPEIKTERKETKGASAGVNLIAGSATGSFDATNSYQINHNIIWDYLRQNREKIIVFDNLESIINSDTIRKELSDLITLCDDPKMNDLDLRFIILGTLTDFFLKIPNYQTIASRVLTVRVGGFTDTECYELVDKNLRSCGLSCEEKTVLSQRIWGYTGGMPQAVNDLCYSIAITYCDAEKTSIILNDAIFNNAITKYIRERLSYEYSIISGYFRENLAGDLLLNTVLISLQEYPHQEFSSGQIIAIAQSKYGANEKLNPKKTKSFLALLADERDNNNILIKTNVDGYKIKTPQIYSCLSTVLYQQETNILCMDINEWA